MSISDDSLVVRSHVARDLLQTAATFKSDRLVIWEYVVNGLQYVDPGVSPSVFVSLDTAKRRIVIRDNGRGMDWAGLRNFFVMHGENLDRRAGRAGRGRFGTGKAAAFGIASVLRITSVVAGRESSVELCRQDIQEMTSGDVIPVRVLSRDVATTNPGGTLVEIEQLHLRSIDQKGVISYIERHLLSLT